VILTNKFTTDIVIPLKTKNNSQKQILILIL